MNRSTTTSSWAVPFVLGATTAFSIVWLSQKRTQQLQSTPKHTSRSINNNKTKSTSSSSSSSHPVVEPSTTTTELSLMDAADLDHRMLRKAEAVIQWRTNRLLLVIERCTNDHNYSAILRTAEALGIQTVYMIDPPQVIDDDDDDEESSSVMLSQHQQTQQTKRTPQEIEARRQHHLFARNALEWLTVRDFVTTEECVAQLRKDGYQLWVTDLSQQAQSLSFDGGPQIPEKVALVMGTEAVGCSQYMLEQADLRVYLPLRGYADSLNLSVATALILHQLFCMDPTLIGSLTEDEKHTLREKWYAKLCGQRILTSAQKKQRQKLLANIKKCESIQERMQLPASNQSRHLQPAEQKRLGEWDSYKEQLEVLDELLDPQRVQAAVQEWVDNPPQPLTDVRRADNHRVCYVGKNTRKHHEDHWKDMVATSDAKTIEGVTAYAFREKVQQQKSS